LTETRGSGAGEKSRFSGITRPTSGYFRKRGGGGEEEEIEQEPEAGSSGPPEEEIEEVKSQKWNQWPNFAESKIIFYFIFFSIFFVNSLKFELKEGDNSWAVELLIFKFCMDDNSEGGGDFLLL